MQPLPRQAHTALPGATTTTAPTIETQTEEYDTPSQVRTHNPTKDGWAWALSTPDAASIARPQGGSPTAVASKSGGEDHRACLPAVRARTSRIPWNPRQTSMALSTPAQSPPSQTRFCHQATHTSAPMFAANVPMQSTLRYTLSPSPCSSSALSQTPIHPSLPPLPPPPPHHTPLPHLHSSSSPLCQSRVTQSLKLRST